MAINNNNDNSTLNNKNNNNYEEAIRTASETFISLRGVLEKNQRGENEGINSSTNESQGIRKRVAYKSLIASAI